MSSESLFWATRQSPGSSGAKLVLLALADCCNSAHEAHPSQAWLVEWTSLNRKTVIAQLQALEAAGLIVDTGRRVGSSLQIKVYRLAVSVVEGRAPDDRAAAGKTIPKTGQSRKRERPEKVGRESQKRDTDTPTDTPKPNQTTGRPPAGEARLPLEGEPVDEHPWLDEPDGTARRLPRPFVLRPRWADYARRKLEGVTDDQLDEIAEAFADHWHRQKGRDAEMLDWPATWRTWIRNERKWSDERSGRRGRGSGGGGAAPAGRSGTAFRDPVLADLAGVD